MGWTVERVETLKRLWLDGLSASQVAKELGGVSRNGVIGKVHRLGLAGRATPSTPTRGISKPARPSLPVKPVEMRPQRQKTEVVDVDDNKEEVVEKKRDPGYVEVYEEPGTATVLTLGAHMCKWPIGEPGTDSFTFCGRGTSETYCTVHKNRARNKTQKKASKTPTYRAPERQSQVNFF